MEVTEDDDNNIVNLAQGMDLIQQSEGAQAVVARMSKEAAAKIHLADQAEQIAGRIKDPEMLENALVAKLNAQRDFAVIHDSLFTPGRPWPKTLMNNSASTGRIKSLDWCSTHGFAERTVRRWHELIDPAKHEAKQKAIIRKCWELAELWQAANFSSEHNEWFTPAKYIEAVREVLGDIDLDPASSTQANAVVRATEIFTQFDDGLTREWRGRVFMNPPYGRTPEHRSLAAAFCNKALVEFAAGNVEAGIILVNSLHSQTWQAPLYDHAVCFVDHRIHFVSADGEENEAPTFQNIFVYLGRDLPKFADVFSRFGYVMRRIEA
jgi:hypothetical protein